VGLREAGACLTNARSSVRVGNLILAFTQHVNTNPRPIPRTTTYTAVFPDSQCLSFAQRALRRESMRYSLFDR
jgi:hypothetical protein